MQTLKFKTNIKCNGCVNAIKLFIDSIKGINSWKVDLESSDKIIEVISSTEYDNKLSEEIVRSINQAGYSAERI